MEDMFKMMEEFMRFKRGSTSAIGLEELAEKLLQNIQLDMLTTLRTTIDTRIKELSASRDKELDPFSILGVSRSSTRDEVEKAYKDKAWSAHPDRGGSNEEMIKVNASYEAIKSIKGWK